ncbi:MAG: ribosome small subunit-dependent GTPase A [Bacteroidales bacterium]
MSKGLVIKSTGSWYYVKDDSGQIIPCKIRGSYRMKGIRATNPVAVGDNVTFILNDDESGVITKIGERKNYIIRRSSNLSREYQLIAANIDQAILMISLIRPTTHLGFIDRFLVSAEAFRIPVVLVFNKIDIYPEAEKLELKKFMDLYGEIGYQTMAVSLKTNVNIDKIEELLGSRVTVIAGNSGVGKSTLMNYLDPELDLRIGEISGYHKTGQHTTTYAEMFFLKSGAKIVDTPGIKGFGMVDISKDELFHFFPEIFRYSKDCRFNNCIHVNEPACAVIAAVASGKISESRYLNYLALFEDMGDKYRK